jgi:hypothetical protein
VNCVRCFRSGRVFNFQMATLLFGPAYVGDGQCDPSWVSFRHGPGQFSEREPEVNRATPGT